MKVKGHWQDPGRSYTQVIGLRSFGDETLGGALSYKPKFRFLGRASRKWPPGARATLGRCRVQLEAAPEPSCLHWPEQTQLRRACLPFASRASSRLQVLGINVIMQWASVYFFVISFLIRKGLKVGITLYAPPLLRARGRLIAPDPSPAKLAGHFSHGVFWTLSPA